MCEADNGRKFPLPFWESSAPEQQLLPFFGACCAVSGAEDSNKKMEVTFFDHGRPPMRPTMVENFHFPFGSPLRPNNNCFPFLEPAVQFRVQRTPTKKWK